MQDSAHQLLLGWTARFLACTLHPGKPPAVGKIAAMMFYAKGKGPLQAPFEYCNMFPCPRIRQTVALKCNPTHWLAKSNYLFRGRNNKDSRSIGSRQLMETTISYTKSRAGVKRRAGLLLE